MAWEVDWSHPSNTGTEVMARNLSSRFEQSREWHLTKTGYLRTVGVNTPTYRADSWEVDWSKRNGKLVWARNPQSKFASAREWHWVPYLTLSQQGIRWQPKKQHTGRRIVDGYVELTRRGMTDEEIALAEKFNLFRGRRKLFVREHHLVAVKKYQRPLDGMVVRHWNGIRSDNRPENLLLGTQKENVMDHDTARRMAMYWREQFEVTCLMLMLLVGSGGR